MKKIFGFILCFALAIGFTACSEDETPQVEVVNVNTSYLDGAWSLNEVDGVSLGEGTYLYLSFDRKENTFVMYHNLESMYSQRFTGTWSLTEDEDLGILLTGEYDYDLGEWATYIATALDANTLHLVNKENPEDVRVYTRCESIPEDVVNGSRSAQ